jgi:hypothetical protein
MKRKTGGQVAGGLLTLGMLTFFLLAISLIVVKQSEARHAKHMQRTNTMQDFAAGDPLR